MNKHDYTGLRFGFLTGVRHSDGRYWIFRCDCGNEKRMAARSVVHGVSITCGCHQFRYETSVRYIHRRDKLRSENRETLNIFQGMHARCNLNVSRPEINYAVRGISVCERWSSFKCFLEDMGPRPSPMHTIERKDNNGNYEPGNCRWATPKEQASNRRGVTVIIFNGTETTPSALAKKERIPPLWLFRKIRGGVSPEDAVREYRSSERRRIRPHRKVRVKPTPPRLHCVSCGVSQKTTTGPISVLSLYVRGCLCQCECGHRYVSKSRLAFKILAESGLLLPK